MNILDKLLDRLGKMNYKTPEARLVAEATRKQQKELNTLFVNALRSANEGAKARGTAETSTGGNTKQSFVDTSKYDTQMTDEERNNGIEVAEFIENVNQMLDESKRTKRKKKIGIISEKHAATIDGLMKTINPNFTSIGYELWIDGTGAQHIEIRHGKNGKADKTMASKEAKALIPWVAQNADSSDFIRDNDGSIKRSDRFYNSDGTRAPEIRLEKHTSDGVIYVSECVPDSANKRIWITSAYINKKGGKGQLLNIEENSSPQPTPEASFDSNATTNIIPDSTQKSNTFSENSSEKSSNKRDSLIKYPTFDTSQKKIRADMTDEERAEILRNKTISPPEVEATAIDGLNWDYLERNRKSVVEKPLIKKLRELGYLRSYTTENVDVDFEFTAGGLRKSLNAQVESYGGTLAGLTKVVLNMQALLDSSVLLEIHTDKAKGTPKENARLVQTYVLLSAFSENGFITPVQFEIKQYVDNENRLYLAVALTKIETGVVDDTALHTEERTRLIPISEYSIPQLIEKINPKDENFFKYIPNEFLDEAQIKAKQRALEREAKKYGKVYSFSDSEELKSRQSFSGYTSREKLAEAFAELATSNAEKIIMQVYQRSLDKIEKYTEEKKELEKKIKKLEGKNNYEAIKERETAKARVRALDDVIKNNDKKLFKLEASKPLQELLEYSEAKIAEELTARYGTKSRGSELKMIANYTHDKVYSRSDAESTVTSIYGVDPLPVKIKDKLRFSESRC